MMLLCNICKKEGTIRATKEGEGVRLVRDHDHTTKIVRGILCEKCNAHLGTYENNRHESRKYLKWLSLYKEDIHRHIFSTTGIKFHGKRYDKTVYETVVSVDTRGDFGGFNQ